MWLAGRRRSSLGLLVAAVGFVVVGGAVALRDGGGPETADAASGSDTRPPTTSVETVDASRSTSTTTTLPSTSATSSREATTTTAQPAAPRPVVVIDPGHNGANGAHPEVINRPVDAGGFEKACNTTGTATDDGYTESAFNWEVAQRLGGRLELSGIDVVFTRTSDDGVGPCIDERGQIAARRGAVALISIHADGAPAGSRGFHVIHPGRRPGYTDAMVGPSAELADVLRDTLATEGFTPSTYVGSDGLIQRDDLGTLNRAEVPSVMLEAGNMRDPQDAAWITTDEGQRRLADAIASAVLTWLGQ